MDYALIIIRIINIWKSRIEILIIRSCRSKSRNEIEHCIATTHAYTWEGRLWWRLECGVDHAFFFPHATILVIVVIVAATLITTSTTIASIISTESAIVTPEYREISYSSKSDFNAIRRIELEFEYGRENIAVVEQYRSVLARGRGRRTEEKKNEYKCRKSNRVLSI